MSMRFLRPLLLVGVPALAAVAGVAFWLTGGRYITTENAYVKADIAHVSAEVDGRVRQVLIDDHTRVAAGEVILELDPAPFEMARARAQAEVDAARQEIRTLIASWKEARSELAEAEGRETYFEAQLERQQKLATRGIIASAKLEEAEEALRASRDRSVVIRQKVQRMLAQVGGDPDRPVDEHPNVREKLAALEEARLNLSRTFIRAPISGKVVNLRLQPGEFVEASKALMAIVALSETWIEANFKETQLAHVREGMRATVTLDGVPDRVWQAEVASISPATGAEFALLPPQNASGNWVKVVQRLPVKLRLVDAGGQSPIRAGMTATVSVDTQRKRTLAQLFDFMSVKAETPHQELPLVRDGEAAPAN